MLLWKSKFSKIEAVEIMKDDYDIIQKTKQIFGRGYDEVTLKKGLTLKQVKQLKEDIKKAIN